VANKSFKRKWRVQVGDLSTEALRVKFKITKTLGKEPNSCDLMIWNLAEASRAKLKGSGLACIVEAGYEGATSGNATIFSGDTRTIDHPRDHADWITHVQCGDGEKAYQFAHVNKSFTNASFTSIVQEVAKTLSPNLGNLNEALNAIRNKGGKIPDFTKGFVAHGRASDTLATLLKSVGLDYSIHQGALLVVEPGQPAAQSVFKLSPETGLIGSPDHTPPDQKNKPATLKCRCLLNPQLLPAGIVRIESAGVKGDFVIQKLEHVGDSHGADWLTVIEAWAKS
jgi:hypothetical protein